MSTNTTNMGMGKAVDGDNAKTYLETTLGAALDKVDAHDHSGTTHAVAIPYGSISAVAWTPFSPAPTVAQSAAVTATITYARYAIVGKLAFVQLAITITGTGTTANDISVEGIPSAIQPRVTGSSIAIGSGIYQRTATPYYPVAVLATATTTLKFMSNASTAYLGSNPAFATANGDLFSATLMYEIA